MDSDDLRKRFDTAKRPGRAVRRSHPAGVNDGTVEATGKLSEALETVERARGHLYAFHQLSGTADRQLTEAVEALRDAGHEALADEVADVLVGREVVADLWTFEIVETYDRQYWSAFRGVEEVVRRRLTSGERHVFEAELKHGEQQA